MPFVNQSTQNGVVHYGPSRRRKPQLRTVYHMMDEAGYFSSNPANIDSIDEVEGTSLYEGPVAYPKMFYHPEGETRVKVPGEVLLDRDGQPRLDRAGKEILRGEQREIIWRLAKSEEEEDKLRAEGWHDHPAAAITAAGGEAPAVSADFRIKELEAQVARAEAALKAAQAPQVAVSAAKSRRGEALPVAD